MNQPLLSVRLSADYAGRKSVLKDASFDVDTGEVLALVGESGSGKSTIALTVLRLLHFKGGKSSGQVLLRGRDLMGLKQSEMRTVRGAQIGLVLQSPLSSLNPALRIGTQLSETWRAHAKGTREDCLKVIRESLSEVRLPSDDEFLRRFPSQLSVGQAQRVIIAMAILHRPSLLIADEPTSALDVITQSEILALFADLNRRLQMAILYISHDLLSVASISHRVAILREGSIVESGPTQRVFCRPEHSYTRSLVAALPIPAETLFEKSLAAYEPSR